MDSKNKFWRGVMVGVLVTALVCLITVGASAGIPVAGATLPVIACCLIAIYGRNPMLFVSTIILGVGHIGIHLNHRKEL